MKVVIFHPVLLPPRDYGGVERVVLWLTKGLIERGHDVWVAALAGSRLPRGARLIEMQPGQGALADLRPRLPAGVDLIHLMAPASDLHAPIDVPTLLTVHGNGKPGEKFPAGAVFLSADHAQRHGGSLYVYNGIDPDELLFEPTRKSGYALFLSKTSLKTKNVRGAVRIASRANFPLVVAGGHRPLTLNARTRFAALFGGKTRWIGPVAGQRKAHALARAGLLLFPILWEEPFGLVVVEALMSGTPVLASRRGAMPELITPGVGACLEDRALGARQSEELWIEWLERVRAGRAGWSPEACRAHAMKHFHFRVMCEKYEGIYRQVATSKGAIA